MTVQIQLRRGTAANWTTNGTVVLAAGEPGFETDTGKFKVGDGSTQWTSLPYAGGLESLRLQDLSNVASTAPNTGEVLKWSGSAWAPAADATGGGGGGATYGISAENSTGGVNLRLSGSDASTDDVKLAEGSNVTITRTDANTITIAATGGGGGSSTLAGLTDVDVTTTPPADGEVLKYNSSSSKWEPAADLTGGGGGSNQLTNGPHTFTLNNQGRIELGDDASGSSRIQATGNYPWIIAGSDNTGGPELSWTDIAANSNEGTSTGQLFNVATTLNTMRIDGTGVNIIMDVNDAFTQWIFNPDGTTSFPGFTLPATDGSPGQVLQTDGGGNVAWATVSGGGGGSSRATAFNSTAIIGDGVGADVNITGGAKTYALLKIQVDEAAWVRVYTDAASRSADSSRAEGVDPTPGAGVIAEIITTGAQTILMSPATIGWSNETVPSSDIPIRVTNKSGTSTAITVTLTFVQLEV
jgi:hypothetical protein